MIPDQAILEGLYPPGELDPIQHHHDARPRGTRERKECIICGDHYEREKMTRATCGHFYCPSCILQYVLAYVENGLRRPITCCRWPLNITPDNPHVPAELLHRYMWKKMELETSDPLYCSNPRCSTFIPLSFVCLAVAICPVCPQHTCLRCKERIHEGECSANEDVGRTMRLARENGWRRCRSCGTVLELLSGCNQIGKLSLSCDIQS